MVRRQEIAAGLDERAEEHTTARGRRMQAEARARAAEVPVNTLKAIDVLTMKIAGHREVTNAEGDVVKIVSIGKMEVLGRGIGGISGIEVEVDVESEDNGDVLQEIEKAIRPAINALLRTIKEEYKTQVAARDKAKGKQPTAPTHPADTPTKNDINRPGSAGHGEKN